MIDFTPILERTYDGPRGPVTLDTRHVHVGAGVWGEAAAFIRSAGVAEPVVVVSDPNTRAAAGQAAYRTLASAGLRCRELVLPDGHPHADDATVAWIQEQLAADVAFLVAAGSGTVNDLVKMAAHERELRYGVVPTAASMNGYTSTIAALTVNGLKSTLPARGPLWVLADTDVIAAAPPAMAAAGFGDLMSKTTATADWAVAHTLFGEWFSDAPNALVEQAFARVTAAPTDTRALTEALILSGLSMAVAGSSSPASGGEHLISHYWDMTASGRGRAPALHGSQVAVATLVSATLHERLRGATPRATQATDPGWLDAVCARFGDPQAAAVRGEAIKMVLGADDAAARSVLLSERWDDCLAAAARYLMPADRLRELLGAAGAPTAIAAIGVPPDEMRGAYLYGRAIRDRYTVLHLAHDAGLLDSIADEVLDASGVMGGESRIP